jgi:hypothetical protein
MEGWTTLMDGDDLVLARKISDTGYWWVLSTTDLVGCMGEEEAAEMSGSKRMLIMGDLDLVPGKDLLSEAQRDEVLKSCGWEGVPDTEEAWVEMTRSYGLKVPVNHTFGATNESAVKKALREACVDLDGNVDHHLDKTINRIGQTGRESLAGDMDSALNRAACHEGTSDEQRLMAQISGPKVKTVKQKNMTSECWSVQVWGLEYCKTCECKGTTQCGGQEIRKTGKNSNGLTVPIS